MIDLKILKTGLEELTNEKRLPFESVKAAMERAFAAAYQKEYGERGQLIKSNIDFDANNINFTQIKIVVDKTNVRFEEEELTEEDPRSLLPRYNEERHLLLDTAKLFKKNVEVGEELIFPLDEKNDFGRIALQTAKQVIVQAIREAEREQMLGEFKDKLNTIVHGTVERVERGLVFVEIGKSSAVLPYEEQIPGERLNPGQRIRTYLTSVEDAERGFSVKLSRTHPQFLVELFKTESSEIADGTVEIVSVSREPGNRAKIAVKTNNEKIDPVGACVGQRGTRINAITSELHGERIDVVLYNENPEEYIKQALSPAEPIRVEIGTEEGFKKAKVIVHEDDLSLAIGKAGQNVRLAARLTGYKLDIVTDEDANTNDDEGVFDNYTNHD